MAVLVVLAGSAAAGLAAGPAQAAPFRSLASSPAGASRPLPYNVGAPHSPQLLRRLAHPPVGAPPRLPRRASGRAAASGPVPGVDVSSYQHPNGAPIGWGKVAASGIKFAAVKATEGTYYTNPYAAADLQHALSAGLSVIAYAFAIPNGGDGGNGNSNAAAQADAIVDFLAPQGQSPVLPAMPPIMLDAEYDPYTGTDHTNECYGLSQAKMQQWIADFGSEIIARTGRAPIIYSTQDWWDACVGADAGPWSQYPLWIANYTTGGAPGMLPSGWTDWGLWQHTSVGTVSGIPTTGHTDLDWFNPDSAIVHGKLMVFNPGYQQDTAGSGAQVSAQVQAYPEEPSPSLSFSATGLPPALSLDPSTGQITGTPAANDGAAPITVAVADSTSGLKRRVNFTWYSHGALALAPPGNQSTVAGSPVDLQLGVASDSPSEPPVSFQAAGLPPGLSITDAGLISGWPDAAGTYQVLVEATDALKAPASETFTWTVSAAPDAGPAGAFRLALGGKCLNDVGDSSTSGTPADLWTCNGSAAQRWTYVQDFTVRIHGKCLSAPAGPGGKVRLLACGGRASQVWRPLSPRAVNSSAGSRAIAFVNPPSGMCLSDATWSTANGTAVVGAVCDGYRDQVWTIPAGPVVSQIPGECVDDRYGRTSNGNPIGMWSCTGTGRQRWTAAADGTFRVEGKCLQPDGGAAAAGTKMVLWTCDGSAAQQWRLIPDGDGEDLLNQASGLCLADPGDKTWNGAPLKLQACAADPGQRWQVQ